MKKWQPARRLLCLFLAMQMLFLQLPLAFASSVGDEEKPAEVMVEEQPTAGETDELTAEGTVEQQELYYYDYQMGYGVALERSASGKAIADYGGYFSVESDEKTYGSRDKYGDMPGLDFEDGKAYTICVFPSLEMLGRVPDRTFAGWHLIPSGREMDSNLNSWVYAEGMRALSQQELLPYNEGDLGYDKYGHLGDTWNGPNSDYSADGYVMAWDGYIDEENPVRFVGRWVSSDKAEAFGAGEKGAALTVRTAAGAEETPKLYSTPVDGAPLDAGSEVAFDPAVTEYWLRVGAAVTELDLTFNAYEPYYDYCGKGQGESPVMVTSSFNGQSKGYGDTLTAEMLPAAIDKDYRKVSQNTLDNPAHSEWTVTGIPLYASAGADRLYNDITVSVTSPSGMVTRNYTFHIQRLAEPTLSRQPGNTPFGMIARDTSVVWGTTDSERAQNKAAARAYFQQNHKFDDKLYPQDAKHNQSGGVFRGSYGTSAWLGEKNIDLDANALVVYQDAAFLDPGISLTDAEGNRVEIGSGVYSGAVKRTLELRMADSLTVDGIKSGTGTACWYADGSLHSSETDEILQEADGSDQIDLRGLNVLPGIYSLEYTYTDPASGGTHTSAEDSFSDPDKKGYALAFRRTLVVLPAPGDVDMDGAVTAADAVALKSALNLPGASSTATKFNGADLSKDTAAALFAYRVCDLTRSNTLEKDDIDKLEQGFEPKLVRQDGSDYYYIPLPTGEDTSRYTRMSLNMDAKPEAAKLSMEFLGVEQGTRHSTGYTINPKGPDWTASSTRGVTLGDTFWVGVKLSDSQKSAILNQSINTFTFTLTYDSRYVNPAVVLNEQSWNDVGGEGLNRWKTSLRIYNLGMGSQTVWGNKYAYNFTAAAGYDKEYSTHYSKAITPLETNTEQGNKLRELVFSIRLEEGAASVGLQQEGDYWLLAVPFTLVKHPYGQSSAQLVEMGAGMREFVFVAPQMSAFSLLNLFAGRNADVPNVAAYSAQAEVFGAATANLQDTVSYLNAGAAIPLGEDKTVTTVLHNEAVGGTASTANAVYSTYFKTGNGGLLPNGTLEGALPPGLIYNNFTIEGIPERAGTYDFSIAGSPFRIVVDKAPLRFYADKQATYYGQPESEFRGEQNPMFTFQYKVEDILSIDAARANQSDADNIVLDGKGVGLAALLDDNAYKAPAFTAKAKDGTAVAQSTAVGVYGIDCTLLPTSQNYKFVYAPELEIGDKGLTILPRPFLVTRLATGTKVGEVYNDTIGVLTGLSATLTRGSKGFVAGLPHLAGQPDGTYNGYPLTAVDGGESVLLSGDTLTISYTGTFQRESKDMGHEGVYFVLDAGNLREQRNVSASALKLTATGSAANYKLVGETPTAPVVGEVTGTVALRSIVNITISNLPPMTYRYGDLLVNANALHYNIVKGTGSGATTEGDFAYKAEDCLKMGITVTWVTKEQKDKGGADGLPYVTNQVFDVAQYNGRYLCVSAMSVDEEGNQRLIVRYSEEPLNVTPLTLTLTAKPVARYYGEKNGDLEFTYPVTQLANTDQKPGLKGEGSELEAILGNTYVAPKLEAVVSTSDLTPVNESTPYSGSKNAVRISGGTCANYVFNYVRSASGVPSADWGDSTLTIARRPIVVDRLVSEKENNLATIYADTKRIYTQKLPLALNEVSVSLPQHTADSTTYYPLYGTLDDNPKKFDMGYAGDAAAVLESDKANLSFTYTATVVPTDGKNYINYVDFSRGYYDMSDADADGAKAYPVQMTDLALTGAAANNYVLVYRKNGDALKSMPGGTTNISGVAPETGIVNDYYRAGYGKVVLRPIRSIEIRSTPKMTYTYGDLYYPTLKNQDTRQLFKVALLYEAAAGIENYPGGNTTSEVVECSVSSVKPDGTQVTTFDDRSISVCWVAPGQSAVDPGKTLSGGQYLTVEEHNGARLAVVGSRGKTTVVSQPTDEVITVKPRPLTLTAADQRRCYGEQNEVITFTFDESTLATPDRDALTAAGMTGAEGSAALEKLKESRGFKNYIAPAGNTTAQPGSDVKDRGNGSYPITLSGGSLSNYELQYMPGALHIYPRPVKINRFISGYPDNPIYAIYADTKERSFTTDVNNAQFELNLGKHNSSGGCTPTGPAVYGSDEVGLKITVFYNKLPENTDLGNESGKAHEIQVTAATLVPGTKAANNYVLEQASGGAAIVDRKAVGAVELRRINSISIKSKPVKANYIYGEALDLSGLIVTIDYNIIGGVEGNRQEDVKYLGADQFARYGLYVNYTDKNSVPSNSSDWPTLNEDSARYRKAETGDHLTVAPTHDTQGTANPFTANGKYLIVSAQRHAEQTPAAPQIVSAGGEDYRIQVTPLILNFALEAGDKTYDGKTEAVGTLTLKNMLLASDTVDGHNSGGGIDQVYIFTGADYEASWSTRAGGHENFKQYITDKHYSFTTGDYVPAGAAPLGENYPLSYTPGYKRETALSFHFLNPNVAYETAPGHDSYGALAKVDVQATGITLAGPDAANYTIVNQVTSENAASALGYESGALPQATIHKANRPKLTTGVLPQVEIDIHTNVLRLTYPQQLSAIENGEAAGFEGELHFEYALQYDATAAGIPAVEQFAGADGTSAWWDERFFGGEAYLLEVPEGYVPSEQDIPKAEDIKEDTVLKGQLYRWSEEDGGFVIDSSAYPGGAQYPGYYIYKTDRSPLLRDTVLIPVVRAAETHNYNASPILSATTDYTPELAQAVADTRSAVAETENALLDAETDAEAAEAEAALAAARSSAADAARAALTALEIVSAKAKAAAQADVALMQEVGESGKWPEKGVWPQREIAPAVKSYAQRIDLVSTEKKQNTGADQRQEFTIPTLEAVWFTDLLEYPESKYFDVATRNNEPTRYYGYAWDSALSAQLKFDDREHPFSLADAIEVEIKRQGEDGKEIVETVAVNEDHTAVVYVNLSSGGGYTPEKSVLIEPRSLYAAVGDPPQTLVATVRPSYATYKTVKWTTSDSKVATVDKNGVVTFVGPGTATITATTRTKKTDSITVTVVASWKDVYPAAIFNVGYLAAFFRLEDDRFNPEGGMTRGEAVALLAQFYVPNENWTHSGTGEFPDLTGGEPYAEAARLLGSLGVITGTPEGKFDGERPITRAEFVVILTRMLGLDVPDTKGRPHAFLDSGEKDTWAYSYIDVMDAMGILNGVGGRNFAPGRAITRVEAAALLTRILRDGVDTVSLHTISPGDVREDYWGYAAILRAVNGSEPKKP